ncbi:MAG: thiol reductase thioredoxin [Synechococcaceae cyanobacterium RL_1_2]|nr:thiol reductase thioredoxin [Synechococcaceae cyanobacterium RL_1_2]
MANSSIITLTDRNFKELLFQDPKPNVAVVDFWAEWCSPCKVMGSLLEKLVAQEPDISFFQLNVDEYPETANEYLIRTLPTLLIFKNGELMQTFTGVLGEEQLRTEIEFYL